VRAGDLKVGIVSPPDISISFLKAHEIGMRIPFSFFESASFIYDYQGRAVRRVGHEGAVN
jgi:putative ABC transport system substrate-binding protein